MKKKREIVLISGLVALLLLVACGKTQAEEPEAQLPELAPQPLDESNIVIGLENPETISSDEEFSVKISLTNKFEVPVALSSIRFPFSDFKFDGKDFATNPNADIPASETKVLEYMVQKNLEDNLGNGKMSSLMQFDLKVNDPSGVMDLSKREKFVIEFI